MCLDVLSMHGEVEEVWSGGAACWFDSDRSLVPCRTPRAHPLGPHVRLRVRVPVGEHISVNLNRV